MANFVKLTDAHDDKPVWVNLEHIVSIQAEGSGARVAGPMTGNEDVFDLFMVKETPEQIMMLAERSNHGEEPNG